MNQVTIGGPLSSRCCHTSMNKRREVKLHGRSTRARGSSGVRDDRLGDPWVEVIRSRHRRSRRSTAPAGRRGGPRGATQPRLGGSGSWAVRRRRSLVVAPGSEPVCPDQHWGPPPGHGRRQGPVTVASIYGGGTGPRRTGLGRLTISDRPEPDSPGRGRRRRFRSAVPRGGVSWSPGRSWRSCPPRPW